MRCGLFGKLSAKRDYISIATPRNFLEVWEPWIQSCMSASQHQLGERWQNAFLRAPLWRFWVGSEICGTSFMGVIMPSLDGVGRYYPLTLHAIADAETSLLQPDVDPQQEWFAAAEDFLLTTLDTTISFETISATLDALAAPAQQLKTDAEIIPLGDSINATLSADKDFAVALASVRTATPEVYAAASFWWTTGGDDFSAMALCCRGLPDPFKYSALLLGNLKEPS